jgi:galactose-1-phosphate uridylyltransferase
MISLIVEDAEALRRFMEEQKNNPWNEYVEEKEFIIK